MLYFWVECCSFGWNFVPLGGNNTNRTNMSKYLGGRNVLLGVGN